MLAIGKKIVFNCR